MRGRAVKGLLVPVISDFCSLVVAGNLTVVSKLFGLLARSHVYLLRAHSRESVALVSKIVAPVASPHTKVVALVAARIQPPRVRVALVARIHTHIQPPRFFWGRRFSDLRLMPQSDFVSLSLAPTTAVFGLP